MPRLIGLKPTLAVLPSKITPLDTSRDQYRERTQEWRGWYKLKRWHQLRWSVFVRDLFICNECGKPEGNTSLLVAHHKVRHRGNPVLFWDPNNLITVCKDCHDGPIQAREVANQGLGGGT